MYMTINYAKTKVLYCIVFVARSKHGKQQILCKKQKQKEIWSCQHLISLSLSLFFFFFRQSTFSHVKHSGNMVAHKVKILEEFQVWLEDTPQFVAPFVIRDIH